MQVTPVSGSVSEWVNGSFIVSEIAAIASTKLVQHQLCALCLSDQIKIKLCVDEIISYSVCSLPDIVL